VSAQPRIRVRPEDFRVEEVPLYPPSGEGSHTFVRIEKRLRTTEEVSRALARVAGVRPGDVGYAGRKDRVAITTQWFSVPGLDPDRAHDLELPGARVLEAVAHGHKLRTGQLRGNRFDLVVRDVDEARCARIAVRLEEARRRGLPNRFGAQRYGRAGDNVARARLLLSGEKQVRSRRDARFLLSALQSAVFDTVLADRPVPLDTLEVGDVAVRHDSGGLFVVEDADAEAARAEAFEISATGPIFGHRVVSAEGEPGRREAAALRAHDLDPVALPKLPGVRLRGARRALRVRPEDAGMERVEAGVRLRFTLPAGSYATVVLEELLGEAPREGD
jgi:tRNA pseudouridine13 synthase